MVFVIVILVILVAVIIMDLMNAQGILMSSVVSITIRSENVKKGLLIPESQISSCQDSKTQLGYERGIILCLPVRDVKSEHYPVLLGFIFSANLPSN